MVRLIPAVFPAVRASIRAAAVFPAVAALGGRLALFILSRRASFTGSFLVLFQTSYACLISPLLAGTCRVMVHGLFFRTVGVSYAYRVSSLSCLRLSAFHDGRGSWWSPAPRVFSSLPRAVGASPQCQVNQSFRKTSSDKPTFPRFFYITY